MNIILDTDIDTDCDDVGALAVLHALAGRGEAAPLGVVCSVPLDCCAGCVQAVNGALGRDSLPVGLSDIPGWDSSERFAPYREHRRRMGEKGMLYNERIAYTLPEPRSPIEDATALYRRLLAGADDHSVTICGIGTLSALAALLDSGADDISPLTGAALVEEKVHRLVSMAIAREPLGRDGFNWRMDRPAAAKVIGEWPTRVTVSSHGDTVLTGACMMQSTDPTHPVHAAYRTFLGAPDANRPSWDQTALLYAVRGAGPLFEESPPKSLLFDADTGEHTWGAYVADTPERTLVRPAADDAVLAGVIEDLMIEAVGER